MEYLNISGVRWGKYFSKKSSILFEKDLSQGCLIHTGLICGLSIIFFTFFHVCTRLTRFLMQEHDVEQIVKKFAHFAKFFIFY